MEYKGKQWHETCFCCFKCKTSIGNKTFIPRENDIFCTDCFEERYATRCVKCSEVRIILYYLLFHWSLSVNKSQLKFVLFLKLLLINNMLIIEFYESWFWKIFPWIHWDILLMNIFRINRNFRNSCKEDIQLIT